MYADHVLLLKHHARNRHQNLFAALAILAQDNNKQHRSPESNFRTSASLAFFYYHVSMEKSNFNCPLCQNPQTSFFSEGENRIYHHCPECDLVFVPSSYFVSEQEEQAKYDNHQNSIANEGYVNFLNRLLVPLQDYLPEGARGLDFGCGPGPTLHLLMEQQGYQMEIYDYFYARNPEVFTKKYDFITSTEVIEHLHHPLEELERLWDCLHEEGLLGLMTAFRVDAFSQWYYKRDLTHIHFFTPETFAWIADYLNAKLIIPQSGVVILKK